VPTAGGLSCADTLTSEAKRPSPTRRHVVPKWANSLVIGRSRFRLILPDWSNGLSSGESSRFPNHEIITPCEFTRCRLIMERSLLKAVLTDSHFWIPLVVLISGIVLLIFLK